MLFKLFYQNADNQNFLFGFICLLWLSSLIAALPISNMEKDTNLVKRSPAKVLDNATRSISNAFHKKQGSFAFPTDHTGKTPLMSPKSPLSPQSSSQPTSPFGSSHGSSLFTSSSNHSPSSSTGSSQHDGSSHHSSNSRGSTSQTSIGSNHPTPVVSQPHGGGVGGIAMKTKEENPLNNLSKVGKKTEKFVGRFSDPKYSDEIRTQWRDGALKHYGEKAGLRADKAEEKLQSYQNQMYMKGRSEKMTKLMSKIPFTTENKAKKAEKIYLKNSQKVNEIKKDADLHYKIGTLTMPRNEKEETVHQYIDEIRARGRIDRHLSHLDYSKGSHHGSGSGSGYGSSHSSSIRTPNSAPTTPTNNRLNSSSRGSSNQSKHPSNNNAHRGSPDLISFSP